MATKQQLTCIVCHEVFTDPVTLHCGHTLCAECISGYLKTQAEAIANGAIPCPNCGGLTKVPDAGKPVEEWVGQIKTGFFVKNLVETLATSPEVGQQLCSVCLEDGKREEAISYCVDCKKNHCHECETMHKKLMKSHTTQSSIEAAAGKAKAKTRFCTEHAECPVDMMCEDCDKVLCHKCCIVNHRRCESVITLEQAVTKIDDVLEKKLLTLEQTISKLKNSVNLAKTNLEMLEESADKAEKDYDATCEKVMSLVVAKQKQMKKKIASLKEFAVKDLQADVKNEEMKLEDAQQKQGLIDQALKSEVPMDHYEMYRVCSPGQVEYQSADTQAKRITQIDFSQKKIKNLLKNLEESGLGNICIKASKKRKLKEGLDGEKKKTKKMMIDRDGEKSALKRRTSLEINKLKKQQKKTSTTISKQQTASTSTPTKSVYSADEMNNNDNVGSNSSEPDIISTIEKLLGDDSESRDEDTEDKKPETVPPLPPGLPDKLQESIVQIKEFAKESSGGKCKFFSGNVNKALLDIEMQSREVSCGNRQAIYTHLSFFLPCGKETLLKRAKKLRLSKQEDLLKDPINKLREAVNVIMPTLLEKYEAENQSIENKEENASEPMEEESRCSLDKDPKDVDETKNRIIGPRNFEWTDHVTSLLSDVVRVKMRSFVAAKQRGQTAEEFISCFLDMEIRPIWPPGWIQTKILYKKSRAAHEMWTNPMALKESDKELRLEDDMEVTGIGKVMTELPKIDTPTTEDNEDKGNQGGTGEPPARAQTTSTMASLSVHSNATSSVPVQKSHEGIKHGLVTEMLQSPIPLASNSTKQSPSKVLSIGTDIPRRSVHSAEYEKYLMATYVSSSRVLPPKPQSSTEVISASSKLQSMPFQAKQAGTTNQKTLVAPQPSLGAQHDPQKKAASSSPGSLLFLVDNSPSLNKLQDSKNLASPFGSSYQEKHTKDQRPSPIQPVKTSQPYSVPKTQTTFNTKQNDHSLVPKDLVVSSSSSSSAIEQEAVKQLHHQLMQLATVSSGFREGTSPYKSSSVQPNKVNRESGAVQLKQSPPANMAVQQRPVQHPPNTSLVKIAIQNSSIGSVPQRHSLQWPLKMSPQSQMVEGQKQTSLQMSGGSQPPPTSSKTALYKTTSKTQASMNTYISNDPRSLLGSDPNGSFAKAKKAVQNDALKRQKEVEKSILENVLKDYQLEMKLNLEQQQQHHQQVTPTSLSPPQGIMPRTTMQLQYPGMSPSPGTSAFSSPSGNTKTSKPLPHTWIPPGSKTVKQKIASAVTHSMTIQGLLQQSSQKDLIQGTPHLTTTPQSGQGVMTPGTTSHSRPPTTIFSPSPSQHHPGPL